jgi:hypothetical protein
LNFKCSGCGKVLESTPKRRYKLKNGHRIYCSVMCFRKHNNHVTGGHVGLCKSCGKEFKSMVSGKKYCNMDCYMADPETKRRLLSMSKKGIKKRCENLGITDFGKEDVSCAYCGEIITVVKSRKKRARRFFCSQLHYRKYLSDRFDRWIASPQTVALPQNYDEFMAQEKLPCPIDGCDWEGEFLSAHVQMEHGVRARKFKKMTGFNLTTGLVTAELSEKMSASAVFRGSDNLQPGPPMSQEGRSKYRSLEGVEHYRKAREIMRADRQAKRGG